MLNHLKLVSPALALVLGALLLVPSQAPAAFTTHFNPLLNELEARSLALSNSPLRAEKRQKQAADLAIRTINRSTTSLRSDITMAGTVARTLATAFKSDFTNSPPADASPASLGSLLARAFAGLQADVQGEATELSALIASLPAGTARTKARTSLSKAQGSLGQIGTATTYPTWSRLLNDALKSVLAGQDTAIKAGGTIGGPGGSSGTNSFTATITVNGVAHAFVANTITPAWLQSFDQLNINASSSSAGSELMGVSAFPFTGATGAYDLAAAGSYYTYNFATYFVTSGTLNITRFSAATHSVEGTFSFTATKPLGGGNVSVNNGTFSVTNLVIIP